MGDGPRGGAPPAQVLSRLGEGRSGRGRRQSPGRERRRTAPGYTAADLREAAPPHRSWAALPAGPEGVGRGSERNAGSRDVSVGPAPPAYIRPGAHAVGLFRHGFAAVL